MLKWRMHTKDAAYKRKEKIQKTAEKNDFISVADAKRIAFELPDIEPEDEKRGWRWSDLRGGSGMRVAMIDSDDKTQQYPYLYICDPTIMIHKLTAGPDEALQVKTDGDLISRRDAVSEIHKYFVEEIDKTPTEIDDDGDEVFTDMPTVRSLLACNKGLSKRIKSLPSAPDSRQRDGRRKCMAWKKSKKKDVVAEEWPCWFHCWSSNRIIKNDGTVVDQLLAVCEYQDGHVERINFDHIRFVEEWD